MCLLLCTDAVSCEEVRQELRQSGYCCSDCEEGGEQGEVSSLVSTSLCSGEICAFSHFGVSDDCVLRVQGEEGICMGCATHTHTCSVQ